MSKMRGLVLWPPKSMDFQAVIWLVMGPTLFITIGNLLSHFKHAYFTLAKTTESLRIDQALNSLSSN